MEVAALRAVLTGVDLPEQFRWAPSVLRIAALRNHVNLLLV